MTVHYGFSLTWLKMKLNKCSVHNAMSIFKKLKPLQISNNVKNRTVQLDIPMASQVYKDLSRALRIFKSGSKS